MLSWRNTSWEALAGRGFACWPGGWWRRSLIDGASFLETFRVLREDHGFAGYTAFTVTIRIYRGGGLTKDAVYLSGSHRSSNTLDAAESCSRFSSGSSPQSISRLSMSSHGVAC